MPAPPHDYMQLFGLVTFAFMWARMAKVAQDKMRPAAPRLSDHPSW